MNTNQINRAHIHGYTISRFLPNMTSIKSLVSFKLDLPPSCIEFFPLNPQYAVIGTYNLQKQGEQEPSDGAHGVQGQSQQRNGSLILVRVVGDNVYVLIAYQFYPKDPKDRPTYDMSRKIMCAANAIQRHHPIPLDTFRHLRCPFLDRGYKLKLWRRNVNRCIRHLRARTLAARPQN